MVITDGLFAEAFALHRARRLGEARRLYECLLDKAPEHGAALGQLGILALQEGRPSEAVYRLQAALRLDPQDAGGDLHEALAAALRRLGDREAAGAAYGETAARRPESAQAQLNLGAALADLDRYEAAAVAFQRARTLDPGLRPVWGGLALSLLKLERWLEALNVAEGGLARFPDMPDLLSAAAATLKALGRLDEAQVRLCQLLALHPWDRAAAFNLATLLKDQGRTDEAVSAFTALVDADPSDGVARIALCMAHLAPLYRAEAEIDRRRAAYHEGLSRLAAHVEANGAAILEQGIGVAQPFALPYQGRDSLNLQRMYGALACGAMAAHHGAAPSPGAPKSGERIRVGFVSGFFRDHSVWRIPLEGWMRGLDGRFEVVAYHTGAQRDAETGRAEALSDRFVQGPLSSASWRELILFDAPHILIYPEIGMDPMSARLAAQRLAPLQANGWGHPVTSGFPTIDLFLSSDFMEPSDAQRDYSEQLVRLGGLSTPLRLRACAPPPSRAALNLREGSTVFWCAQSPSKYLPHLDGVFPQIAERVEDCQFVFAAYPGSSALTTLFEERLMAAFAVRGLDGKRACLILPRLAPEAFAAAAGCADVVLDSLEWSGCNSLVDTLAHDLPVVTLPGGRMRGRHGAAILSAMGLNDQVACSLEDYVDRAVRLAHDRRLRVDYARRIAASKHKLTDPGRHGADLGDVLQAKLAEIYGLRA